MNREKEIIKALDNGLDPNDSKPFKLLSQKIDCSENEFISGVKSLITSEKIKRFGIVLKNRSLGLVHNAMVVINIPKDSVDFIGEKVSGYDFVKLCYQREPIFSEWNYNLYFMIHGKDREVVQSQILKILTELDIKTNKHEVLFSSKCLKQKGASYY